MVPLREHLETVEERVILPKLYITTLAYRKKDKAEVNGRLADILKRYNSEKLPEHIAKHEWENRFKIMVIKRLGPSLAPAEVVVPLSKLGQFMSEIEQKINQPMVKEGIIVRDGASGQLEAVGFGAYSSDQRKFRYKLCLCFVLTVMQIARKYGGRPYSTGLYYASKADEVLGQDRVERIKALKKKLIKGAT